MMLSKLAMPVILEWVHAGLGNVCKLLRYDAFLILHASIVHAMQSTLLINLARNTVTHVALPTKIMPLTINLLLSYLCRIIIASFTGKRNARCSPRWRFLNSSLQCWFESQVFVIASCSVLGLFLGLPLGEVSLLALWLIKRSVGLQIG